MTEICLLIGDLGDVQRPDSAPLEHRAHVRVRPIAFAFRYAMLLIAMKALQYVGLIVVIRTPPVKMEFLRGGMKLPARIFGGFAIPMIDLSVAVTAFPLLDTERLISPGWTKTGSRSLRRLDDPVVADRRLLEPCRHPDDHEPSDLPPPPRITVKIVIARRNRTIEFSIERSGGRTHAGRLALRHQRLALV